MDQYMKCQKIFKKHDDLLIRVPIVELCYGFPVFVETMAASTVLNSL